MILPNNDTHFDALMRLAFEPPPIAQPAITVIAVRIRPRSAFPEIMADRRLYPVIGVTPGGWLSVAHIGWHRFTGDPVALPQIARACNTAQRGLVMEADLLKAALARYAARADTSPIGGLPIIHLECGRRTVRLADITVPEVSVAIQKTLAGEDPVMTTTDGREASRHTAPDYIDADFWWKWCHNWCHIKPHRNTFGPRT